VTVHIWGVRDLTGVVTVVEEAGADTSYSCTTQSVQPVTLKTSCKRDLTEHEPQSRMTCQTPTSRLRDLKKANQIQPLHSVDSGVTRRCGPNPGAMSY
jgi:hypothetical protein